MSPKGQGRVGIEIPKNVRHNPLVNAFVALVPRRKGPMETNMGP